MNLNEWGIHLWFSVGFDLRGFDALSIEFTKPDLTTLTVTNPAVSVGTMDVQTIFGTFPANKYADYVFTVGQVDQEGEWSARLTYTDSTQHLISDVAAFVINP